MHRIIYLSLSIGALLSACVSSNQSMPDNPSFVTKECAKELTSSNVTCGSVAVPENHQEPDGRKIDLNVIVLRALQPPSERVAQFELDGGPGLAATDGAGFYATDGAAYRRTRDVVLIDMRGTGASNPLRCPALEQRQKADPLAPLYPPDLVADCAKSLSTASDLRQYTTEAAARDIDHVREALGYRQIDLSALSYGTTLALRYIADFPERVRLALLMGTAPAHRTPPRHHATSAERALKMLFDACGADPTCAAQYPDLEAELDLAMERQRRLDPVTAPVLLENIRSKMYAPDTARRIPALIRQLAQGNVDAFRPPGAGGWRSFADGLYLSITCAESLARMNIDAAIEEAKTTRFGAYRLERQRDACAHWPVAPPDPDLFRMGTYETPVLFISGARDPVTLPDWTAEAAKMFPNSLNVIIPQSGHIFDGLTGIDTCLDPLILHFFDTGLIKGLDTSCLETMRPGPFAPPG